MYNTCTSWRISILIIYALLLFLVGCTSVEPYSHKKKVSVYQRKSSNSVTKTKPYKVLGKYYHPLSHSRGFSQKGVASWYGKKFHGRKTANGETYNMHGITAAHKTLPLGTYVRVRNLKNGKVLDVRINDRGPFARNRIIDLSYGAAKKLGVVKPGTAPVKIVALGSRKKKISSSKGTYEYKPLDYYSGSFTVQVGAFTDLSNARRLMKKLSKKHGSSHIAKYVDTKGTLFYRVRTGSFLSLSIAEKFEKKMIKNGFPLAFIVAE